MKWLEKIRAKSFEQKRIFALGASAAATLFIFIIWLTGSTIFKDNQAEVAASASPFSDIKESISPLFDSLGQKFEEVKEAFSSLH